MRNHLPAYIRKKMKKILLVVALIIPGFLVKAQNIATTPLAWKVDACLDVNTGTSGTAYDQVLSYSNTRIEWRSIQGDLKHTFTILEVNGQWSNVTQNGTTLYEVESNGRRGTVQFSRTAGAVFIHVLLLKDEGNAEQFTLSVSTITTL
jgi:hypothetical protein